MTTVDDFAKKLLNGTGCKEYFTNFVKYQNNDFEILVFDNKVLVKDKRNSTKTVIYNNLSIAKANLESIVKE
jgi:hypothetical protein